MKRIILAALVGVLVGLSPPAAGQTPQEGILAGTWAVYVQLLNNVTDGCFPNTDPIKNAVELKFLANGFKIIEDRGIFSTVFLVDLIGTTLDLKSGRKVGCVVFIKMSLAGFALTYVPWAKKDGKKSLAGAHIDAWSKDALLVGDKEVIQSKVKGEVENMTDEAIIKIFKTRQEVFAKHPHMKKNFEEKHK